MAHNYSRRTSSSFTRAQSSTSTDDGPYTATRSARLSSVIFDSPAPPSHPESTRTPPHYLLPPTIASPYAGSLDASLDAIADFGAKYAGTQSVTDTLLKEVDERTNWPVLLQGMVAKGDCQGPTGRGRFLLETFLFLVTRTLLPEQITENRALMARLYERRKQLAIRVVLRYDMLREWKVVGGVKMEVPSLPPAQPPVAPPSPIPVLGSYPDRRPLLPNIIPTLIVAPQGGWTTHAVRERMKHHVTDLDDCLLLRDEDVARWNSNRLLFMAAKVVLIWQWLRANNEVLGEMEISGWENLEGSKNECEWIAPDLKDERKRRDEKVEEREKD